MNYLNDSISPKFPFRDSFQKAIESNTRDYINSQYGKSKTVNKEKFFSDMRDLKMMSEYELSQNHGDYLKTRLIWLEIKSLERGKRISIKAYPELVLDGLSKKGDLRVSRGLIEPFMKSIRWASENGIELPKDLDAKIYFWIADKPPWDVKGYPVFIPSAIPGELAMPLFPDISYFYMQFEKKYTGEGIDYDMTKKLFDVNPNVYMDNVVYFRGANTTRHNSDLRQTVVSDMHKHLPKDYLDLNLQDGFTKFDPLYEDGLHKKYLLDLPGKFPWSVRFKMLFLFNGSPTIIKVNERWIASDGSWDDGETPWKQWVDSIIPSNTYVSLTHIHTQITKTDEKTSHVRNAVDNINKKSREKTLKNIADIVKSEIKAEDPKFGHDLMTALSIDRIYQMIFRMMLTMHSLNKV